LLVLLLLVALGAALQRRPRLISPEFPLAVNGVALGETGIEIQERYGKPFRQLPAAWEPDQNRRTGTLYRHLYATPWGPVDVEFDPALFTALTIRGARLEYLGREVNASMQGVPGLQRESPTVGDVELVGYGAPLHHEIGVWTRGGRRIVVMSQGNRLEAVTIAVDH
jgi:hypothetical protein